MVVRCGLFRGILPARDFMQAARSGPRRRLGLARFHRSTLFWIDLSGVHSAVCIMGRRRHLLAGGVAPLITTALRVACCR
jgi:hypothetical protein